MNDHDPLYLELVQRCNGTFVPRTLDDFIGAHSTSKTSGARAVAELITKAVKKAKANGNSPIKFLLNGAPGLGKSALASYTQQLLGCDKWSTEKLNGTQIKIETIEEIARSLHYGSLTGDYRMIWFDEVDEMSRMAQVRALTMLDEMRNGIAIVCTSNCPLKNFENRFQTRFQAFELAGPQPGEIESLLLRFEHNVGLIKKIVAQANGNVRQALLDLHGVLQAA